MLLSMYVVKFCLEWEVTVSMPNIYKGDDMPLASAKRGYVNAPVFTHELFPRHDTALTPCFLSKLAFSNYFLQSTSCLMLGEINCAVLLK